jgi:protein TonB
VTDKAVPKVIEPFEHEFDSNDWLEPDEFDGNYEIPEDGLTHGLKGIDTPGRESFLKYCLIASLLLHLALFVAIPRLMEVAPEKKSLLKPGETVRSVRLVEPPQEEKKPEPPPEQASAISDRDHTAIKERIPKAPPMSTPPMAAASPPPEPPLGKIEPQQKMASLAPPLAPERFVKSKEDPKEKKSPEKAEDREDKNKVARTKTTEPEPKPKKRESTPNKRPADLMPTPQDFANALRSARSSPDFFPDGDVEEAVVDINTREDRFFSYLMHLKRKIQGVWVYPQVAARSGLGGSLTVEFSIAKTGDLIAVNLLDSSGHAILDESAMKAIKSAAPYHPFPERLRAQRLRIRANFVYVTSSFFRSIM